MSKAQTQSAESSLRSLVEVELWPDERIIWVGQPVPRIYAFGKGDLIRKAGLLSGITFLIFLYFALCGTPEVWYAKVDFLLVAGLGTFALVLGLGFLWFYQDAKHIVYAITNKRSLIFFLESPVQLDTGRVHPWKVRQRRNGAGDLMFPGGITFYAISNVGEVTSLLTESPGR
jgi:hypothetical protein